jgi:FixJ family two-component response regulator
LPETKLISIIDDDVSVGRATGSLVRSLGFEAQTFTSAEDFLRWPRKEETSCIICDVQMPGMSGLDLCETLAAQGSRTPIIFITAFSQDRVRRRAGDAACILQKPFDASELAICLKQAVLEP